MIIQVAFGGILMSVGRVGVAGLNRGVKALRG